MAESPLQLNHDGSTSTRKTVLWPSSKSLQEEIIRKIFEQKNWKVSNIKNIKGSHWKISSVCNQTKVDNLMNLKCS